VWNSSLFTVKVLDLQTFPISIAFLLFIMEILGTSLLYMPYHIYDDENWIFYCDLNDHWQTEISKGIMSKILCYLMT
jgi:hypothetical protein